MKDDPEKIKQEKSRWEEKTLKPALQRFKLKESPTRSYSPSDLEEGFNFLDQVGFPGQYPFTAGNLPHFPLSHRRAGVGRNRPGERLSPGRPLLGVRGSGGHPGLLPAHEEARFPHRPQHRL